MKKSIIITLIVAGALVLFGAGLFAGAMSAAEWDFGVLNSYELVTNTYEIDESFTDISIKSNTTDIRFAKSSDGKCRVVVQDYDYNEYKAEIIDGTLKIELTDTREWYEYITISFSAKSNSMTVYLPEDAYGTLTVKEDTGDIEIPENFSFESMDIELDTGDVVSYADTVGTCRIAASTGDIKVENASVGALAIRTTTGKITASDVICVGNVSVNVSTGKSFLTGLTCQDLTSTGSTGDITLKNVIASGAFDITRDSGDVTFEGCDATTIKIKTDTGDVKGTLLTPKIIYTQTNTGRVEVPKSTTGGICEITTDTGDIKIWIQ